MVRTFTTILKTPHAKCLLVLQAPYKQLIYKFTQQTNITDRSELANHDQPTLLESYSQ